MQSPPSATAKHNVASRISTVAATAWVAGPLSIIVINGFFIKLDPKITMSHSVGYLARFAIAGATAGYLFSSA